MTNYGRIDGFWFDCGNFSPRFWDAEKLFTMMRSLQPWLVINNRCGLPGDYDTPEQRLGKFQRERPWETCMTLGTQWTWKPGDKIKSLKECIDILATCAVRDGNLVLNTGPMPDGRIEACQTDRFREIGAWLAKYGQSIYGTRGGPFRSREWGGTTHRDDMVYVHVLKWPAEGVRFQPIPRKIASSTVLTGGTATVRQTDEGITIDVPPGDRQELDTIIALKLDGPAETLGTIPTRGASLTTGKRATASNVYRKMAEFDPKNAVDDDTSTRWGCDYGTHSAWLEVDLGSPQTFDRAWISEPYDRVRKFELQAKEGETWRTFHRGTTIGEDLDVRFEPVTARHVRLILTETTEGPSIWEFQLFATQGKTRAAKAAERPVRGPQPCWLKTPDVSIMTGFIYEPQKPYTIQEWMKGLGSRFDADRWVKDFQDVGASYVIFYDKWIDGLVFHDTKTTNFKTKRDFVRELAAACQRGGLPMVFYFNAVNDGNPEFKKWALLDKQGKRLVFSEKWPEGFQTLCSPFRGIAIEQVRELLGNYGPIHGFWFDIFGSPMNTSSPWMAKGFQEMFGEPFDKASLERLGEFSARTLAGYLDEVDAIRREKGQPQCIFTANGSAINSLRWPVWNDWVGARLDYLYFEGHRFDFIDGLARMAWVVPKPLEICLLLNSSWFTPMEDKAPPSHLTEKQALAAAAVAVCQGAGINLALTPGHSGVYGEDLQRAKAIGAWFRQVKPYVENAQPYADVAIVLGTPAPGGPGLPATNPFWNPSRGKQPYAWQAADSISYAFARCGVPGRVLYVSSQGGNWPASLDSLRAIVVPEMAVLDDAHLRQLRAYVERGGRLIAFGHSTLLDEKGQKRKDYGLGDVLGLRLESTPRAPREEVHHAEREEYGSSSSASLPAQPPKPAIRLSLSDPALVRAFGDRPPAWAPLAVRVEPTTAEVIARLPGEPPVPAILKNRLGRGDAYFVATADAAFTATDPFWKGLASLAVGEPTLSVSPEDANRYRIILTRIADAHVLHVIDSRPDQPGAAPRPVTISLLSSRLGGVREATLAGSNVSLPLSRDSQRASVVVQPDPVATVILK